MTHPRVPIFDCVYKKAVIFKKEAPFGEDTVFIWSLSYSKGKAYKDAGNALFKAAKYAWAIRTYEAGVDALASHCYESRERMLWDYFARVPCGQCYSNAALCALKLGEHARAAALCEGGTGGVPSGARSSQARPMSTACTVYVTASGGGE